MPETIFCVACGSQVAGECCPSCQTPNVYRERQPWDHARERLSEGLATEAPPVPPEDVEASGPSTEPWADGRIYEAAPAGDEEVTERIDVSYRAKLVCREPKITPREIRLSVGVLVVGRPSRRRDAGRQEADILIHHRTLSRRHAELICESDEHGDPRVSVRDIGSTNGTMVNSRRIGKEPVEVGWDDEIVFGEVRYRLRIHFRR